MQVVFQANLAPTASLKNAVCSLCHRGFPEGSKTASHPEASEPRHDPIQTVFHTVHFECMRDHLSHNRLCPICDKTIVALKEKTYPRATAIANEVARLSFFMIAGSFIITTFAGALGLMRGSSDILTNCVVGSGGVCFLALCAEHIIQCLEDTTLPPKDPKDSFVGSEY